MLKKTVYIHVVHTFPSRTPGPEALELPPAQHLPPIPPPQAIQNIECIDTLQRQIIRVWGGTGLLGKLVKTLGCNVPGTRITKNTRMFNTCCFGFVTGYKSQCVWGTLNYLWTYSDAHGQGKFVLFLIEMLANCWKPCHQTQTSNTIIFCPPPR